MFFIIYSVKSAGSNSRVIFQSFRPFVTPHRTPRKAKINNDTPFISKSGSNNLPFMYAKCCRKKTTRICGEKNQFLPFEI